MSLKVGVPGNDASAAVWVRFCGALCRCSHGSWIPDGSCVVMGGLLGCGVTCMVLWCAFLMLTASLFNFWCAIFVFCGTQWVCKALQPRRWVLLPCPAPRRVKCRVDLRPLPLHLSVPCRFRAVPLFLSVLQFGSSILLFFAHSTRWCRRRRRHLVSTRCGFAKQRQPSSGTDQSPLSSPISSLRSSWVSQAGSPSSAVSSRVAGSLATSQSG